MKGKTKHSSFRLFAGFLLLLFCLGSQTKTSASQGITIDMSNVTLVEVLREIQRQSAHTFVYNNSLVDVNKRVSVRVSNEQITKLMDELLNGSDIVYRIVDTQITLSPKEFTNAGAAIQAQSASHGNVQATPQVTVTGQVTAGDGTPLAGVTVRLKGTLGGSFTNADGIFLITVPSSGSTLIFSFIGYETQEIVVGNERSINVSLDLQDTFLSEVVVTGYQTISRDRSAGSFTKPNEIIVQDRAVSINIAERLEGLVPGFTINLTQGSSPTGTNRMSTGEGSSNQFIIRGIGSIQSERAPLYVVNGIAVDDLSLINPNDVESITVLKDATASSVWGSRAANGVVVITTKKGTRDERIRVQYDAYYNFKGKPDYNYFPMLTSSEFIQTAREVFDPVTNPWNTVSTFTNATSKGGVPPHEVILYNQHLGRITEAQANAQLNSLAAMQNNGQIGELFYRNQTLMNQTVSVTGGSSIHNFYGSFSHTNNQSYMPGERDNQYNVNVRQDFSFNKRLRLFLITDLVNAVSSSQRAIQVDNRFLPYQVFRDENGHSMDMSYITYITTDEVKSNFERQSGIDLTFNPYDEIARGTSNSNSLTARVTAGARIDLYKGLKFEGTYGYSRGAGRTDDFESEESFIVRSTLVQFTQPAVAPSTVPTYHLPRNGGNLTSNDMVRKNWTVRNQFVFDREFSGLKHQVTILAGQEAQERFYNATSSIARGYDPLLLTSQHVDYNTLATTGVINPVAARNTGNRSTLQNPFFSEQEMTTRVLSFYGTGGYTLDAKYTFNASLRSDRSNLFGTDKSAQSKPTWSLGAKWLINGESFMKGATWINMLALRATYGITGNAPTPGSATSHDVLIPRVSNFAPGPGLGISTYANKALTWERTENSNIGIDFGILNRRITASVDYYKRAITDLIGQFPVNFLAGASSIVGNYGDMTNRGVELSLTTRNITSGDFFWQSIINLSYNKNTISRLEQITPVSNLARLVQQTKYFEGYPALSIFAYSWAGLDEMGDPQIYLADGTLYKAASTTNLDIEGGRYMGTFQPLWNGGFINFFGYKNFTLSSSIIFNLGHYGRRDALQSMSGGRLTPMNYSLYPGSLSSGNAHREILDRWKNPGDELLTDVPAYITTNTNRRNTAYYVFADINVYDASYIKMRDITLSYTLPKGLLPLTSVDEIRFRLQVANVMLWKANPFGLDPEFQITDINFTMDRRMPVGQGAITLGVNVKF